jgi:hypothetical protein
VHVHVFGTATLPFSDGIAVLPGSGFAIAASPFARPLCNLLVVAPAAAPTVTVL